MLSPSSLSFSNSVLTHGNFQFIDPASFSRFLLPYTLSLLITHSVFRGSAWHHPHTPYTLSLLIIHSVSHGSAWHHYSPFHLSFTALCPAASGVGKTNHILVKPCLHCSVPCTADLKATENGFMLNSFIHSFMPSPSMDPGTWT